MNGEMSLKRSSILISLILGLSTIVLVQIPVYGHGLGFEVLPPISLGDKEVSLEVSSSLRDNPENPEREITFSLFEASNGNSVKEVTYQITAFKGNELLFEDTFRSDNGVFIMDFFYSDSDKITIQKENQDPVLDFLGICIH